MTTARTALLIRCSQEEASAMRAQAQAEHRTISGCVLNILERRLSIEEHYGHGLSESFAERKAREFRRTRQKINRTAMLLRCSAQQAQRIRAAARKRQMSISDFVVFAIQRHWEAAALIHTRPVEWK